MMRLTWVAFLMLMLGCVGAAERLTVRGACFRVRCPDDPGSATLLLHNPGAQPVQIDQVLMDASPLPVFGVREGLQAPQKDGDEALASAGRIYWARLDPNPIPPGRSGLLYVQFRTRPPYAFGLRLNCGAAPAAACKLFPIDNPVRITNIAFPRDCRKCLVHVENASRSTTERLKAVELNDADVTAQAWISSRDLPPGAHVLIVISSPALKPASFARVLLSFDSGRAVAEEVRALPVFPIALEHGGPAPELGITEAVREYPTDLALDAPPPPAVCCLRIFSCPAHAKGNDWQGVAAEALRRRAEAQKSLPSSATFLATCRARAELACPAFAHIGDFGHLNPFLPQYSRSTPPQPLDAIFRAMAMLRAANAPDPVFALLPDHSFGDEKTPARPEELSRLVHAAVACGARGLLYRLNPTGLGKDQAQCLAGFHRKLRRLEPLLLLGEPTGWASSSNPQVQAKALMAGTDGLLLFLLNQGDKQGRITPAGPAEVTVQLPDWFPAVRLTPDGDPIDGSIEVEARRIRVRLKTLSVASILVFRADTSVPPPGRNDPP